MGLQSVWVWAETNCVAARTTAAVESSLENILSIVSKDFAQV